MKTKSGKRLSLVLAVCIALAVLLLPTAAYAAPPLLQGTDVTDGLHVELTFDQAMAPPGGGAAGFSITRQDGVSRTITSAELMAGDSARIILTVDAAAPLLGGEDFYLRYTPGTVESEGGEALGAIPVHFISNNLPHPELDESAPPPGTVSVPYTHTFTATGGTPPYAYYLYFGDFPPGLSLDPLSGVLSGTPTAAGNFSFRIMVIDAVPSIDQFSYAIDISDTSCPMCEIGGTPYTSLDLALADVPDDGTPTTIRLLQDSVYNDGIEFESQNVIFDLNGHTLEVIATGDGDAGLWVMNGSVNLSGTGALNVTGTQFGLQVMTGGNATVTNATASTGMSGAGVLAEGGLAHVTGNVVSPTLGAYARTNAGEDPGEITVIGAITASNYIRVGDALRAIGDHEDSGTDPDYLLYTDGQNNVWVRKGAPTPAPTSQPGGTTPRDRDRTADSTDNDATLDDVPKTGDGGGFPLWVGIAGLALMASGGFLMMLRKRRRA